MTTVNITSLGVYVYDHVGKMGVCIAVSSIVQTYARILEAADCLEEAVADPQRPSYVVQHAVGDVPTYGEVPDDMTRMVLANQRAGKIAFVQVVTDGVVESLRALESANPELLQVNDKRKNAPIQSEPVELGANVKTVPAESAVSAEALLELRAPSPATTLELIDGKPEIIESFTRAPRVDDAAAIALAAGDAIGEPT